MPPNRITGIMNGTRAVSADTALRLGHYFGMAPQFWLNLQQMYELSCAAPRSASGVAAETGFYLSARCISLSIPFAAGPARPRTLSAVKVWARLGGVT
jgi:hypothetical protein